MSRLGLGHSRVSSLAHRKDPICARSEAQGMPWTHATAQGGHPYAGGFSSCLSAALVPYERDWSFPA